MNLSKCRFCGKKINIHFRQDALFCSDLCRKRHFDITKRPKHNRRAKKSVLSVAKKEESGYYEGITKNQV